MSSHGRPDAHVQRTSARLLRRSLTGGASAALACLAGLLGCGSQSLVPIDVVGDAPFSNVELRIFPSVGYPKTLTHVSFSNTTPLAIGIYLPEKASGKVQLMAEANDGRCVVGRGTATASDVQAGVLSPTVTLSIAHVTGCDAPTGGTGQGGATGAGGAGAVGAGAGGMAGAVGLRNLDGRAGGADETGQPSRSRQRFGSLVAAR